MKLKASAHAIVSNMLSLVLGDIILKFRQFAPMSYKTFAIKGLYAVMPLLRFLMIESLKPRFRGFGVNIESVVSSGQFLFHAVNFDFNLFHIFKNGGYLHRPKECDDFPLLGLSRLPNVWRLFVLRYFNSELFL